MPISLVPVRKRLTALFEHPMMHLGVGFVLIASAGAEVLEPWLEGTQGADVGAEHGILLLGLIHGMKALVEFFEGVEKVKGEGPHPSGHGPS